MSAFSPRGLRARLVLGFAFVSGVTALLSVVATVVIGLAVYALHPVWMTGAAHFVMGDLPTSLSNSTVLIAFIAVALLVLALTVAAALLVARRVLRPVGQLAHAADRVAAGDLGVRLEPDGQDELARLVETFNTMTARVSESVHELRRLEANARRFASDVSHELRSPLAAMTAVTEVLQARPAMDADEASATRLVVEGIDRLSRLVGDLMEISRFDAGTVVLDRETVRLADAVAACLALRDWGDRVEIDIPAGLVVDADRRRLDVILANLVGNALRHGNAPFEVFARHVDGVGIRVAVRDHGAGLAPDVLPDVFERFFKAEAARTPSDGSGLGLAIALENARLHGGEITAGNAGGGGAMFVLTLPVDASLALEARAIDPDVRVSARAPAIARGQL